MLVTIILVIGIRIRNYISNISKNKIVLLSTQVVQDIESIANETILLKSGKLFKKGAPSELIQLIHGKVYEKICTMEEIATFQEQYHIANVFLREDGEVFRILVDVKPEGFEEVTLFLGLEDVYLYYFER